MFLKYRSQSLSNFGMRSVILSNSMDRVSVIGGTVGVVEIPRSFLEGFVGPDGAETANVTLSIGSWLVAWVSVSRWKFVSPVVLLTLGDSSGNWTIVVPWIGGGFLGELNGLGGSEESNDGKISFHLLIKNNYYSSNFIIELLTDSNRWGFGVLGFWG